MADQKTLGASSASFLSDGLGVCKSCKHRDTDGYCLNEKLAEERGQSEKDRDDMLIYDYNEGGGFWVGERFGCIHHTPNAKVSRAYD